MINNICVHTLIIRITSSFHAPVFIETESKKCLTAKQLHDALVEHGVRNLHEPGDVRANDEITPAPCVAASDAADAPRRYVYDVDSRLRSGGKRDGNARASGRVQRVLIAIYVREARSIR